MRTFCIASAIGILFGLLIGNLLWADSERKAPASVYNAVDTSNTKPDDKSPPNKIETEKSGEKVVSRQALDPVAPKESIEKEESQLFSKALLEYFHERFAQSWKQHRVQTQGPVDIELGEERFREGVLRLPAELAKLQAVELNEKDKTQKAVADGNGLQLLEQAHNRNYTPDPDDVAWKEIDRCCERRSSGDLIDGTNFITDSKRSLSKGATLHFPRGVHMLEERRLRGKDRNSMPSDVLISGDGMDATLLKICDISPRSGIDRLRFQDLTLYMINDGLFDVRSGGIVIDLENVRVAGFDAGHGGCQIFAGDGALIRAKNVHFIGGYGKSPGKGKLFGNSAILARFDNCRFELIDLYLRSARYNSRISFQNCVFASLNKDPMQKEWKYVDFHDCITESVLDKNVNRKDLKKDLTVLFPQLNERD